MLAVTFIECASNVNNFEEIPVHYITGEMAWQSPVDCLCGDAPWTRKTNERTVLGSPLVVNGEPLGRHRFDRVGSGRGFLGRGLGDDFEAPVLQFVDDVPIEASDDEGEGG